MRRLQRLCFGLGHEAKGPGHFDCAAELEDLLRMQLFRDAEVREEPVNEG